LLRQCLPLRRVWLHLQRVSLDALAACVFAHRKGTGVLGLEATPTKAAKVNRDWMSLRERWPLQVSSGS